MALPIRRTDGTQQYSPDTGELIDRGDPGAQQAQYISKDNNVLYNINGERLDSMGHPTGTFTNIKDLDYFSDRFPPQGAVAGGKVGDKSAEVAKAEAAFRAGERGDYTGKGTAGKTGGAGGAAGATPLSTQERAAAQAASDKRLQAMPVQPGTDDNAPQGYSARPLNKPYSYFTSPTGRRLVIPRGDMTGLRIMVDPQGNQWVDGDPQNAVQDNAMYRAGERGLGTERYTPPNTPPGTTVYNPNAPQPTAPVNPATGGPATSVAPFTYAGQPVTPGQPARGTDIPGAPYPQPAPSMTSFGYQPAAVAPQRGPGLQSPQGIPAAPRQGNPWNGGPFGPQRDPGYTYAPPSRIGMLAAPVSQAESVGAVPIADPASGLYDTQMQRQALAARQEDAYNLGSAPNYVEQQPGLGQRLAADPRFDQEMARNWGLRTDFQPMTLGSTITQVPVQAQMYPGANTPAVPWNGVDVTPAQTLPAFEKPYQGGSYWNPPMPGGWGGNW